MNVLHNEIEGNFTIMPNQIFQVKMSLKAIGLYAFMASKPEGWNFTASSIGAQLGVNRKTVLSAMDELKQHNFLSYQKNNNGSGEYTLYAPKSEKRTKPKSENATVAKTDSINNTDLTNKTKRGRFTPPSVSEVEAYANSYSTEKGKINISAESFVDFYESKGWYVGKNKMKDWKAAVRNWISKQPDAKSEGGYSW